MSEPKILSTSPNPDKIKNKMEIEEKWATSIVDKHPEGADEAFTKELAKFENPIQIWIKGQVLSNMNLSIAELYLKKAEELGYTATSGIEESINSTTFVDGTYVFSTKDKNLADKIKSLINENLKQVFQYDEFKFGPWTWNMFNEDEKLDVKKKEYNSDALTHLINADNFLKFTYHNLMTGDLEKDLDMIWKKYVKEDPAYSQLIKTFEGHVAYYESVQSVKFDFYNRLSSLLEESKLMDKVNISEVSNFINALSSKRIIEGFEPLLKVELKNILSELKSTGIIEKLNASQLTFEEFDKAQCNEKLIKTFGISEALATPLYNKYLLPILKESLQFYHIGNKEFTSLFNIITAIVLTNNLK